MSHSCKIVQTLNVYSGCVYISCSFNFGVPLSYVFCDKLWFCWCTLKLRLIGNFILDGPYNILYYTFYIVLLIQFYQHIFHKHHGALGPACWWTFFTNIHFSPTTFTNIMCLGNIRTATNVSTWRFHSNRCSHFNMTEILFITLLIEGLRIGFVGLVSD